MPDKWRSCGKGCERCWRNRLIHANPTATRYVIKHDSARRDFNSKGGKETKMSRFERGVDASARRTKEVKWNRKRQLKTASEQQAKTR